jgi:hypothetical protein
MAEKGIFSSYLRYLLHDIRFVDWFHFADPKWKPLLKNPSTIFL